MTAGQNNHPSGPQNGVNLNINPIGTVQYLVHISTVPQRPETHSLIGKISLAPAPQGTSTIALHEVNILKGLFSTPMAGCNQHHHHVNHQFPLRFKEGIISMYTRLYAGKSKSCDDSVAHRCSALASCLGELLKVPGLESIAFCTTILSSPSVSPDEALEYAKLLQTFKTLCPHIRIAFFDTQTVTLTEQSPNNNTTSGTTTTMITGEQQRQMYSLYGRDFDKFLSEIYLQTRTITQIGRVNNYVR